MTMLGNASNYSQTPTAVRRALANFVTRLARLIKTWVAAVIAHREYQANLVILRSLNDRELRDIGLERNEIGQGLAEAAKARSRMQQSSKRT